MRTRAGWIGIIITLCFFSATMNSLAAGHEIIVNDSDSLHYALEHAMDGDVIILEEGEYIGNFVINAAIVLTGKGKAHINGEGNGYPLVIAADDVTVEHLIIEGSASDAAGIFSRGNRNKILNNRVKNVFHGVLVRDGYGNIINGNHISSWDELSGSKRYGYAMYVINGDGAIITNNQTYNTQDGVWVSHSNSAQVSYNRFINARYGIHTMYANNIAITHNEVRGSYNGGMIMQSRNINLKFNYFHLNKLSDGTGIFGYDLFDSSISENIIKGNSKGIFLSFAQRNEIYKNEITENVRGIEFGEGGTNNWIFLNNFFKNTQQIVTNPENENVFNVDGYGNFWDEQRIVDLDESGINDFAYKSGDVFYQMSERDPFLQIFFESPAVRLWNTIEQYTHIPSDTFVIDEYPLSKPVEISQQVEVFQPEANQMGFTQPLVLLGFFTTIVSISIITLFITRRRTI